MRYEHLLEPVSEDAPCGPNLEDDDDFVDYYYEAEARIPERFVSVSGEVFDRKSIDLKSETAQIDALLERTRDLRLIILQARFFALAGQIEGFSECVQVVARLLQERWADVHPQVDGDPTERRNQLELLDDRSTVVMPLEHATLIRDRRLDEITLRGFQLAKGEKEPRADEVRGDAGTMQSALRSAENAEAVEKMYETVSAALEAVKTISATCRIAESGAFAPTLDNVTDVLTALQAFLGEARPELAGEEGEDGQEGEGEEGQGAEGEVTMVAVQKPGAIANHPAAAAALLTVEHYFARCEPSAPGLLLIRQARKLIGKPLTVAIDTLLPSIADKARIDFGSETGFEMSASKLRKLAEDTEDVDKLEAEAPEIPEFKARTRAEAMTLMAAVESFFRQTEPSSPVPVLLFKAKNYMNRDFSAIVTELFATKK